MKKCQRCVNCPFVKKGTVSSTSNNFQEMVIFKNFIDRTVPEFKDLFAGKF